MDPDENVFSISRNLYRHPLQLLLLLLILLLLLLLLLLILYSNKLDLVFYTSHKVMDYLHHLKIIKIKYIYTHI